MVAASNEETTMTKTDTTPLAVRAPREHSKTDRLLTLLRTGTGASLEEMTEATGWQSHTVRAAMTGLRKRGFEIKRHVEGNTTVWSVAPAEAEASA
jgi:biotin operon repressor